MNFFKNLFKKEVFIPSAYDKAIIKDAILIIILNVGLVPLIRLQYELLRCGISITQPELKLLVLEIEGDNLIDKNMIT